MFGAKCDDLNGRVRLLTRARMWGVAIETCRRPRSRDDALSPLSRRRYFEIEDVLDRDGFPLVHHRRVTAGSEHVERGLVEKRQPLDDAAIAKSALGGDRALGDDRTADAGHDGLARIGELAT